MKLGRLILFGTCVLALIAWGNQSRVSAIAVSPAPLSADTSSTYYSLGAQDGWVLESTETSNVGGSLNSGSPTILVGDNRAKKQYRSILAFNTGNLPDNARITSVKLTLTEQAVVGDGNPFSIFQGMLLDIRKGYFGTSPLQITDFQAAASKSGLGPFIPALVSGKYTITLPATAFPYINRAGTSQLRLRFKLDDNNNAIANTLSLYSGDATLAYRPKLVVTWHLPWIPTIKTTWQWQLSGLPVNQTVAAGMYDIDLFDNSASVVAALHARGRKAVCYVSAGSWENWRPDAGRFPPQVIGNIYPGWPDEKWLAIRRIDLLAPIMRARMDMCQAKGFDALEPDNIDGYLNNTGFPLTYQNQRTYNIWLANEAHARGLSIGLKNDADQVTDLLPYFDWALTEDCFDQGWCNQVHPFIHSGKAVFAAEYTDTGITFSKICTQANVLNFSAILKHRELDAWRKPCP